MGKFKIQKPGHWKKKIIMASKTNLSVVIDIGTSKMAALAGQKNSEGRMEILGASMVPSRGIKRGAVLNMEEAAASIKKVLRDLEDQIG